MLADFSLGRFFISGKLLHVPKNAFPLHFFLQRAKGLFNVIFTDGNAHGAINSKGVLD